MASHKNVCQPGEEGFTLPGFMVSPSLPGWHWKNYRGDYLNSISRETQSRVSNLSGIQNTSSLAWNRIGKRVQRWTKMSKTTVEQKPYCVIGKTIYWVQGQRSQVWISTDMCCTVISMTYWIYSKQRKKQARQHEWWVCWSKALFTLASFTSFTTDWFLPLQAH